MSKSSDLSARKSAAVPNGVGTKGIYVVRAENSELWDVDGQRYIDFAAGIGVLNTGHRHPRIMAAVAEQAACFAHTCFHVASYESYVHLAERLNALAPGDFAEEDAVPVVGCRGARERGEDRALSHQALGRDRLLRGLPRPHADDNGAHRQSDALQAGLRTISGRDLPRRVSAALPRYHHRAGPRGPGPVVPRRRRSEVGGGHRHRARAGRGRLQRRAVRFPACAARCMRRARHRAHRRRGAEWHRTHRQDVLHRAFGRRTGPHHDGQGSRRRTPAVGCDRPGGDHGFGASGRSRWDLRRKSVQHRGRRTPCSTSSRPRTCVRARRASVQNMRTHLEALAEGDPQPSATCAVWAR